MVTVLTNDIGNTFPVSFRFVVAEAVDPVGNTSSCCPQVHGLSAWVYIADRRSDDGLAGLPLKNDTC